MWNDQNREQFKECIEDLIDNPSVQYMSQLDHHVDVSCLDHSVFVAYISFLICRRFHCDFKSAARAGLLHDLFLYDWKVKGSHEGMHGFSHPKTALKNASELCDLNEIEKDAILKHMWPMTLRRPRFKESFIVNGADKLCALAEMLHIYHVLHVGPNLHLQQLLTES